MKILASILITVSVVVGAISAVTAYVPRLDSISRSAAPLTLNAAEKGQDKETVLLTPELIEKLEKAGVQRVNVKEFSWGRWDGKLPFLFAVIGLLAGGLLMRATSRREIGTRLAAGDAGESPEQSLQSAAEEVARLVRDVRDGKALPRGVVERLDGVFRTQFTSFVEARPLLIGRLGISGYVQLMDRFAAAERQLNRAWSAAADNVPVEMLECLEEGLKGLGETAQRLSATYR